MNQSFHGITGGTAPTMLSEGQVAAYVKRRLTALDNLYFDGRIGKGEHQTSEAGLRAWAELETTYIAIRHRR